MSKSVKLGKKDVPVTGKFRLDVNRDKKKFALTNINAFVPYGKTAKDRIRFKTESGEVDSLIIDKIFINFKPDENLVDNHNVMVFIQHPDVKIGGMSAKDHEELARLKIKKPNPKFTITNIDKVETDSFDNEVELIEARGILFSKKTPLSKQKLVWLCSNFGVPYRSSITDAKRYKIQLIKSLDRYIQSSSEAIERFMDSIENIKNTEMKFYINELKNIGVITDIGGIYKIGDRPIGATDDHLIVFYEQNSEMFLLHQGQVKDALAGTIMA